MASGTGTGTGKPACRPDARKADGRTSITEAQALVMQELWRREPLDAREISGALTARKGWRRTPYARAILSRFVVPGAPNGSPAVMTMRAPGAAKASRRA